MIHVTALVKGPERYVLCWSSTNQSVAMQYVSHWAHDARLAFTWADFAVMADKMKVEGRF